MHLISKKYMSMSKNTYPQLELQSKTQMPICTGADPIKLVKFSWKNKLGNFTIGFLYTCFHALVLFGLISSNTTEVRKECGDFLWIYILSRFVLAFLECIFLAVVTYPFFQKKCDFERESIIYTRINHAVFLIILHIIYICIGAVVVYQNAMEVGPCEAALSSASLIINAPLLGIIGYVYLFMDSLVVMLAACACCHMLISNAPTTSI